MSSVLIASHNIVSPLGFTTDENFMSIQNGKIGVQLQSDKSLSNSPFYGAVIDSEKLDGEVRKIADPGKYTRFEKLLILSITNALRGVDIDMASEKTCIIISTTKGNIDLLETDKKEHFDENRIQLWKSARYVQEFFGNPNKALVLSNACISGALAIIMGADYIQTGRYNNVIVAGADILTKFVVSGFQSFMALDEEPCKPYDKQRNGLNLGEGCGTVILSNDPNTTLDGMKIVVAGGASANDANHISGPSRSGDGLASAIKKALKLAGISAKDLDYLSAHGTATVFNDEMESLAFSASGLSATPVNSLKRYYGHTLGAAGTIESILALKSMTENLLVRTAGYDDYGVSGDINVIGGNKETNIDHAMKTASGFGGCNVALVFSKV